MAPDPMADLAERGAVLAPFEGIALVAHFGDVDREWRAAREGAALFPAGHRRLIAATGGDRVEFLQGMLSNDVAGLRSGRRLLCVVAQSDGQGITDLRVYADTIACSSTWWRGVRRRCARVSGGIDRRRRRARRCRRAAAPPLEGRWRAPSRRDAGDRRAARTPLAHVAGEFEDNACASPPLEVEGDGVRSADRGRAAAALRRLPRSGCQTGWLGGARSAAHRGRRRLAGHRHGRVDADHGNRP